MIFPGKLAANGQEQMGQVQISTAFNSPDLLQNCLVFLRQYASDMGAHAACATVPKQDIAYPQVLLSSKCMAAETWHMATACSDHKQHIDTEFQPKQHSLEPVTCFMAMSLTMSLHSDVTSTACDCCVKAAKLSSLKQCTISAATGEMQVWKMKGWSHGLGDGLFVQLEALKPVRTCWFISASTKQAEIISNDFKVLEPIFQ